MGMWLLSACAVLGTFSVLFAEASMPTSKVPLTEKLQTLGVNRPGIILRGVQRSDRMLHEAEGPDAFQFNGDDSGVCLRAKVSDAVQKLVHRQCHRSGCFVFSTRVRLEKKLDAGVLMSITKGENMLLEIVAKRNTQVRVYHGDHVGKSHSNRLYYELAMNEWNEVKLVFCPSTGMVELFVNCNHIYSKMIRLSRPAFCHGGNWTVCVGMPANGSKQPHLTGSVQEMFIQAGGRSDVAQQCKSRSSSTARERYLEEQLKMLRQELVECKHRCFHNGTSYKHNERIAGGSACSYCTCQDGEVFCKQPTCDDRPCRDGEIKVPADPNNASMCCDKCIADPRATPVIPPGGCRYRDNIVFTANDTFYEDEDRNSCKPCHCVPGQMYTCKSTCPRLTCSRSLQHRPPNKCCSVCLEVRDACKGNPCGPLGKCTTLHTGRRQCMCFFPLSTYDTKTNSCKKNAFFGFGG